MSDQFKIHIQKFVDVSDDAFADILGYFQLQQYRKKENLLVEGQVCKANFFVLKGLLRKFFINEKGIEQTTEFAIENCWMTDTFSFTNQTPTDFCIQAVENTELLMLHHDNYEKLLQAHPLMERYLRCVYQKAYAAVQMRIKFQYDMSREEMYHFFKKSQPQFLQRVPQYLIASYLGFTPEYLSEIRKKAIS